MTMRDRTHGFSRAVSEAVTDIREKLVEIGWFGRALVPQDRPISQALGQESNPAHDTAEREDERERREADRARAGQRPISEALGWSHAGADAASAQAGTPYQSYGHDYDHGIDR